MKRFITAVLTLSLLFLFTSAIPAICDTDTKKVRNITGRCEITRHITLEQAEQKALQDAKTNALRKAGVPEKLWSVTGLISENDGSEFSQVLSRMTTLSVDGYVNIDKVDYTTETIDGRPYAIATIDATVKKGGSIDPTFAIDLNNIDAVYQEGEELTFSVKVYGHDAYLKIFWFDDKGGSMVFPNAYESNRLFMKEASYTFPSSDQLSYLMEKQNKESQTESINIIIVATKKNIPFLEKDITFDSLLKWIYTIPADQRAAQRAAVLIK